MRNKNTLVQLLLNEMNGEHFITGLCSLIWSLDYYKMITFKEYEFLKELFLVNRPAKRMDLMNNPKVHSEFANFWWPVTLRDPRIKFLESLLNQ